MGTSSFCSTGYGDDSPFGVCELHDPILDSYIHWTGSCLLLGNSMDEHDPGQEQSSILCVSLFLG